ncbi:hypothetical protein [Streptosporangium sp. NPDC048865]|uniref:hypothetical protein n=1 Tax=Streptosporangium sp. NPDC048865 TaxID=3155766 RepID=UPI00342A11CA
MRRVLRGLLTVAACLTVVAGIAALPLISEIWEHRRVCAANYDSIEAALTPFDLLDAAPAGATSDGERGHECGDTDDHHATVSRHHRPPERYGSREDIESFYRDLALRNGWRLPSDEESAGGSGCVVKEAGNAGINFEVRFAPDSEDGSYIVSASTWPC